MQEKPRPQETRDAGLRVVLVESVPGSESPLARDLVAAGCVVDCVSVVEACAAPQTFDDAAMVIAEIRLDQPGALQIARLARQRPGGSATLLLSTSKLGYQRFFDLSHEAGFDVHIVKPLPVQRLLSLLASG